MAHSLHHATWLTPESTPPTATHLWIGQDQHTLPLDDGLVFQAHAIPASMGDHRRPFRQTNLAETMAPHNVPFDGPFAFDPLPRAIEQTQPRNLLDIHAGDHTLWLPDTATLAAGKWATARTDRAFGSPLSTITVSSPYDDNRRASILWELAHTPEQHHFDSALVSVTASTLTPLPSDSRAPWFLVLLAVAAGWWALQASSRKSTRWAIETNAPAAKPQHRRPKQASLAPGIQTREMRQVVRHARRIQSRRRMNARRAAANQKKSG